MASRICDQEAGRYPRKEQNTKTYNRGEIGARARNLVELIGADRVSRREYQYEGTCYVTEEGETYDKEYIKTNRPLRTGVSFYEVSNWIYNTRKQMYEPIVRRIVMIKNTNNQLLLNL